MKYITSLISFVILSVSTGFASDPPPATRLRIPLHFVENAGQWGEGVHFGVIRGTDKAAFTRQGVRLYRPMQRSMDILLGDVAYNAERNPRQNECATIEFVSPSPNMRIQGADRIETHTNFYRGSDSTRWRSDVPTFAGVRYVNVWDGIDIEYGEHDGTFQQRVILHAGADPRQVRMRTTNLTEGAGVSSDGTIDAFVRSGDTYVLADTTRPRPYRNFFEKRKVIETEFNTYLGGSGLEAQLGIEIDDEGNIHIAGITTSLDFPLVNPHQKTNAGGKWEQDCYVTCLDENASNILFSTYLGGRGDEWGEPQPIDGVFHSARYPIKMDLGTSASTHVLCNTESSDFPITGGTVQSQRPAIRTPWKTATCLTRLSRTGELEAATWLGGPTFFGGECLRIDPSGNVFVLGVSAHEQWFVTPGTLQDSLHIENISGDSLLQAAALLKLSSDYTQVRNGTYLFENHNNSNMQLRMEIDDIGNVVLALRNHGVQIPAVNSWRTPDLIHAIVKIDSALSQFIFTTGLGSGVYLEALAIDNHGNILTGGQASSNQLALKNPLIAGAPPSFLAKIPSRGGDPIFSTYLPTRIDGHDSRYFGIYNLVCGDILIHGIVADVRSSELIMPLDTISGPEVIMVLDPSGQKIRSLGPWHVDDKYVNSDSIFYGSGSVISKAQHFRPFGFLRNQNLTYFGGVVSAHADSITPLRAIQPRHAGGENDLFLFRTRVPGCALLECSVNMTDTVRIVRQPPYVNPARMTITAEVANIDPQRRAREVECVLTLPKGLLLDPPTQSPRKSLGASVLGPSETATFSWTVRVDTATISGKGVWVDVVTYFKDADLSLPGAPSASPCEHYLRIEYQEYGELDLACTVTAPERLAVNGGGNGYTPEPFPVLCSVRNTGSKPVTVAQFGFHFGGDIGGIPVPPAARYQPGVTLAPGDTHMVSWQARAEHRFADRTMRVQVIGEDEHGAILSFCETDVFVPGLEALRCQPIGGDIVQIDGESGTWQPDPLRATVVMQQVLDTILLDCTAEIDLSACRYVRLQPGQQSRYGPVSLRSSTSDTVSWLLDLAPIPDGVVRDTILYRLEAGGGVYQSICRQILVITTLEEGVECSITAPDTLAVETVQRRDPVYLDFRLTNTGTLPLEIDRYELVFDTGSGMQSLDPRTKHGNVVRAGRDTAFYWLLRAEALRTGRMARGTVTAYDAEDTILSVCTHEMWIPGVEGSVSCALHAADTVRFNRSELRYEPEPLTATMTLTNPLDDEETGIELEIDLTHANRFMLSTGETSRKSLSSLNGASDADITWQLIPRPAPNDESQEVIVRYRSVQQTEWKECRTTIFIEAWPEEATVVCATGGHDSLYADSHYEQFIPDPLHVSYTVTNTGTVALTGCEASIILPPEFALAGSDSTQSFTSPAYANQPDGPVSEGTILPNASSTRWWKITPTQAIADTDPKLIRWQWTSDQQGAQSGCERTMHIIPENPQSIVLTPLHLYFEAERGGALPSEQHVQLWTGGGLSMPWTAQPSEWWLDAEPVSGSGSAHIAVQPSSTTLDIGAHGAEILLAATPANRRVAVTYVIRKSTGIGEPDAAPGALTLDAWPQPVPSGTRLHVRIGGLTGERPSGEACRLTLHDMLGRERLSREVESGRAESIDLGAAQLTAGVYLLRVVSEDGAQAVRMVSVVR